MIERFSNRGAVMPQCAITADPRRHPDTLRFEFAQKVFRLEVEFATSSTIPVEENRQRLQLKTRRPARLRALRCEIGEAATAATIIDSHMRRRKTKIWTLDPWRRFV